jgi:hypothetical protein
MHSPTNQLKLYIGKTFTGILVVPDDRWPDMYRVAWLDQMPSGMVNLTRAKDAAMRWAGRGGGSQGARLNWKATERHAVRRLVR